MIGLNDAFTEESVVKIPTQEVKGASAGIFSPEGFLQEKLKLEHRPQQELMAMRTLDAWERDEALFFEAGTGVGKSLAYLLPGLMRSMAMKRPMVVSTHTIALQEQIESKDLPICRKLFSMTQGLEAYVDFKHAILLGRGNYLCGTRLRQALNTRTELFPSSEQKELERIADWAHSTQTGLRQELSPEPLSTVWEWVHADGHACNPRNCTPKTCFFRKAREAVRNSNLVIVNHSLLFALLAAGHFPRGDIPGILFPEDFMVLDEAHTLPAIATDYFGLRISALGLKRNFQKLYQSGARRARGLLVRNGNPGLRNQILALTRETEVFFSSIWKEFLSSGRPFHLRKPGWIDNPLDVPLRDLLHALAQCENRMEEGSARDELEGVRHALQAYREGIREAVTLSDPDSVYWLETAGAQGNLVHLRSAPLDVAPVLRERLFNRNTGLLLTSATLAEGSTMDSFKAKVGGQDVASSQTASPFDYRMQMKILIHQSAPVPSTDDSRLDPDFLSSEIFRLASELPGGTMVLFTSYRDLGAVQRRLEPRWASLGRPLLFQGGGMNRSELLECAKRSGEAILLGTDSFWTGVDIPGAALSQVVITRLPFENPSHPVAEARAIKCREEGLNPFSELILPAALIKFRQGIGRLIRNQTDEGRLVILDSRILTKPYGTLFLEVLPHSDYRRYG